jgi:hypothetical protein
MMPIVEARDAGGGRSVTLAVVGLGLVVAGVVGYFVVILRLGGWLPGVRNHAAPVWLLVGAGLALSIVAVRRAAGGRRIVASILLGLGVLLGTAFGALFYVAWKVPEAHGPANGTPAPDFALLDQRGRTVQLADFRGNPLLLVFYRGHW